MCWIESRTRSAVQASDVGLQLIQFARVYLGLEPLEDLDLAGRVAFCLRQWRSGDVLLVLDDVQEYAGIKSWFRGMEYADVPRYFLESCQKGLERLEIKGQAFIPSATNGDLARRTVQVKERKIVGYGVVVEGLSPDDSLKLQWYGLGGRQHFGCGWFYPIREDFDAA